MTLTATRPRRAALRPLARAAAAAVLSFAAGVAGATAYTVYPGTLSGLGPGVQSDGPNAAETRWIQPVGSFGGYRNVYARSGPSGLGMWVIDNATSSGSLAIASLLIDDILITSISGNATSQVRVGFGARLQGHVRLGGPGGANGSLQVSVGLTQGNLRADDGLGASFSKDRDPDTAAFLPTPPFVLDQNLGGALTVDIGQPLTLTAYMELRGIGSDVFGFGGAGVFEGHFEDSLDFDPDRFFDLPVGYTANSVKLGLVNNRLPAFATEVPEPATAALMALALAVVGVTGRRRQA